ncbi:alpha/beta hydrolase [Pseudonocardia sp. KRD291]|uniref:alpha/beta hydrolase n=1 Tax=Pseudonocardia sp. KRD291 TaxID=2792007 RepID=UPI001C4A192C|nr:alpha/beta fold hydrolase [Pseudonocardia sp. KRD291]MBW0105437.1 alpha/beta hydrolase [Pseudonocardia sp. KRD291]
MSTPTFVLVPGAFCNAACWGPVLRELALRGHRALAVDLPGHGFDAKIPWGYLGGQDAASMAGETSPMTTIGTADDVAAVTALLRRARAHGPTVLVGASRGGLTLTAVGNAEPGLVDHLVYASAHCPVPRTPANPPEMEASLLHLGAGVATADPADIGALRMNWRTADPDHLLGLQTALLADGTRAELLAYLHTQDPDESVNVDMAAATADAGTWGAIPRTYVRLTEDRAIPPAMQDRYIADADALTPDNRFDVHEIVSSHLRFQIHPEPFADVLDGVAARMP